MKRDSLASTLVASILFGLGCVALVLWACCLVAANDEDAA